MNLIFKYLIVIVISLISYIELMYGVDPSCTDCRAKTYKYLICKNVNGVWTVDKTCSNDPLNQRDDWRPFKKCISSGITFDATTFDISIPYDLLYVDNNDNGDYDVGIDDLIFSADNAVIQLEETYSQWLNICSPKNDIDCDDCTLYVQFTTDEAYFNQPSTTYGVCNPIKSASSANTCEIDCNKSGIYLNKTAKYLQEDATTGFPLRFYYTDTYETGDQFVNFKSNILHELGHWLGFGDLNQNDCYTISSNDLNSNVMYGFLGTGVERTTFSTNDICQFELLYCCDAILPPTNVNENLELLYKFFEVELYPNPVETEKINLKLLNEFIEFPINYKIYDNDLRTIVIGNFNNTKETEISLNLIPSGIYFIEVSNKKEKLTRKFIIKR